jgi:hypothetical protein
MLYAIGLHLNIGGCEMRGAIWLLFLFYNCTGRIASKTAATASVYSKMNRNRAAAGDIASAASFFVHANVY